MPAYADHDETEPTPEQLLGMIYKEVCEIKDIVTDLQSRQKQMDARQINLQTTLGSDA